ncbi:hypothetical protein PO124_15385 [Bacillus licheniformis]|nr:hypothetical protein [Bacillus licheniformis]
MNQTIEPIRTATDFSIAMRAVTGKDHGKRSPKGDCETPKLSSEQMNTIMFNEVFPYW